MELLGADFPYADNSLLGKHALICGASKGIGSATAKMITESSLSILLNNEKIPEKYGVLTPASGIGLVIIDRLKDKGITFTLDQNH